MQQGARRRGLPARLGVGRAGGRCCVRGIVMVHPEREAFFDTHPLTGAGIEVFYADRSLETFGRCGAGWFWWPRLRSFAPAGPAIGPFPTSYAAYRHAVN